MSAVGYDASLLRRTVGQDVPDLFVDAIPYGPASASGNQAIKLGMGRLSADPDLHVAVAGRIPDADMSVGGSGNPGAFGGPHMSAADDDLLDGRVSRSVAEAFSQHALPDSPLAQASGDIANLGPQVVRAEGAAAPTICC